MTLALQITAFVALVYFALLNAIYVVFTGIAWRGVTHHLRARSFAGVDEAFASPLTPPISILLPAYNEETGIVESVRSLLTLRYPELEIVVASDGSTDGTIDCLNEAFDLVQIRKVLRDAVTTEPVRAAYVSRRHPELLVLDKENGGKADALNAALAAARYPLVCAIDADAMLEEDALIRVAKPMLDDPQLVAAVGGIVRIANGCRVDHGRVVEVGLPRSPLATLQVVEYLRAFLVGRMGWSSLQSLLIISGAFGLFRRSLLEAVGGWRTDTVGEDVELVMHLHRYLRDRGEDYRIEFVPDPVCWTEAPEDLPTLGGQRRRWQRGLAETLWRHRGVLLRPRYGVLGFVAFPYFVLFELLGPLIQLVGLPVVIYAYATGRLSLGFLIGFLVVSVLLGLLLSVVALAIEEFSFRRHPSTRDVLRLLVFSIFENIGYRQLNDYWRLLAFVDLARRKSSWGAQRRRGIGYSGGSA